MFSNFSIKPFLSLLMLADNKLGCFGPLLECTAMSSVYERGLLTEKRFIHMLSNFSINPFLSSLMLANNKLGCFGPLQKCTAIIY
jgi:hypothetical protein